MKPANALRHLAEGSMVLCLAVMVGAVFVNVVLRYVSGTGIVVTEELARLLFIWLVSVGAILASADNKHLGFDLAVSRMGPRTAVVSRWLTRLLIGVSLAYLIWGAWQQVLVGIASKSPVMNYPLALAAGGIFVMGVFMMLLLLAEAWAALRGHERLAAPPTHLE
jgi:TRAP-type C4-dicarboxylate transport system permease small subunit